MWMLYPLWHARFTYLKYYHQDVFILKRFARLLPSVDVVFHGFIETQFPRSSSGFCEKFAGNGGSDPGQTEDSRSAHIVDSASCFLDLNSNGDLVIHALADLDLNSSIELLSGGGHDDDNQHSMNSCDTAELLRTPSPCVVESDHEAEPFEAGNTGVGVEASNPSSVEQLQKAQVEQDQSATISSIHKENSQGFCIQMNDGIQSTADIPATSTPKKQTVNGHSDSTQILEGRYIQSAYRRDGTRVGWYCYTSDSQKIKLIVLPKAQRLNPAPNFCFQICGVMCTGLTSLMEVLCSVCG